MTIYISLIDTATQCREVLQSQIEESENLFKPGVEVVARHALEIYSLNKALIAKSKQFSGLSKEADRLKELNIKIDFTFELFLSTTILKEKAAEAKMAEEIAKKA